MTDAHKSYLRDIWAKHEPEEWYGLVKQGKINGQDWLFLWKQKVKDDESKKMESQAAKQFDR